jgi:hypothetical protein
MAPYGRPARIIPCSKHDFVNAFKKPRTKLTVDRNRRFNHCSRKGNGDGEKRRTGETLPFTVSPFQFSILCATASLRETHSKNIYPAEALHRNESETARDGDRESFSVSPLTVSPSPFTPRLASARNTL